MASVNSQKWPLDGWAKTVEAPYLDYLAGNLYDMLCCAPTDPYGPVGDEAPPK